MLERIGERLNVKKKISVFLQNKIFLTFLNYINPKGKKEIFLVCSKDHVLQMLYNVQDKIYSLHASMPFPRYCLCVLWE